MIDFSQPQGRAAPAIAVPAMGLGVLLRFPETAGVDFVSDMRRTLARFASTTPGIVPMQFGITKEGTEFCRLMNNLTIGCGSDGCYSITDGFSGYVDHGPFRSLYEVCHLVAGLAA